MVIKIQPRKCITGHKLSKVAADSSKGNQVPILRFVLVGWLLGTIALLPVLRFELPLNMALADFWILMALPVSWLYLIRVRQTVRLPYIAGMWLILLGSFICTLVALEPFVSLNVLLKEIYLYIWFVTLVAFLSTLKANHWRLILLVWLGVILLHGCLLLAQFLSPEILLITSANVTKYGARGAYRPIGLTENANMAASFQLTGFVPLLLLGLPRKITLILGLLVVSTVIATGSMGATLAVIGALTTLLILSSIVEDRLTDIIKISLLVAIVALLLGGGLMFYFSQHSDQLERVKYMYYGRAERSAEGRFFLWETAEELLSSKKVLWGVGANNFIFYGGNGLHNDLLAFFVERGLIGGLGLIVLAITIGRKPIRVLLKHKEHPDQTWPALVLLMAIAFMFIQSLTHQVFHFRFFWLVLAVQEALIVNCLTFETKKVKAHPVSYGQTKLPASQRFTV